MKRWSFLLLVPCVAFLVVASFWLSQPTVEAESMALSALPPLFTDNFEDGVADGWMVQAGRWSVITDGTYVYNQISTTLTARTVISPTGVNWTDYSVRSKVKLVSVGSGTTYAMLMARYQDANNHYFLTVRPNNRLEIKKMYLGSSGTALATKNYTVTLGTWYTATLEVRGSVAGSIVLVGSINGTPELTATDTLTPFLKGPAGLGTSRVNANFDDVVVSNIPATLSVIKSGAGSGSVSSTPAGIDCGTTCTSDFILGTVVTLTATAGPSSVFTGWDGGGCSGTGPCVVLMNATKSVTATFTYVTHPLTVTKSGTGSGTVSSVPAGITCGITCTADFALGTVVTLTAAANPLSTFTGWDGDGCSGTGPCVLTMNAPKSVTATFVTYRVFLPLVLKQ